MCIRDSDNMIDLPAPEDSFEQVEVLRGPNIKPLPQALPLTCLLYTSGACGQRF